MRKSANHGGGREGTGLEFTGLDVADRSQDLVGVTLSGGGLGIAAGLIGPTL